MQTPMWFHEGYILGPRWTMDLLCLLNLSVSGLLNRTICVVDLACISYPHLGENLPLSSINVHLDRRSSIQTSDLMVDLHPLCIARHLIFSIN